MTDKTITLDPNFKGNAGCAGFVSQHRMEKVLRDAGQLREDEAIEGYRIEDAGLNFYVKKLDIC